MSYDAQKAAEKARAKGGLALFKCPSRHGELRLTPSTCAASHKMSKDAQEVDKVRLWECIACPVGAENLAALGAHKPAKAGRKPADLTDQMKNLLKFVKTRGRVTVNMAAAHFERHRGPVHLHMMALENKGMVRRAPSGMGPVEWEVAP